MLKRMDKTVFGCKALAVISDALRGVDVEARAFELFGSRATEVLRALSSPPYLCERPGCDEPSHGLVIEEAGPVSVCEVHRRQAMDAEEEARIEAKARELIQRGEVAR